MFEHIKYKESRIKNGLTIITAENNSIPVVDTQIWTRTGFRYEKPNELGYAHLLEHMLFQGTKRRPTPNDLNMEIDRRGGYFNASTGQEFVRYATQMMSQDSEFMCDILSDVLFNSLLNKERLESEKKVVLQELKIEQEDHNGYLMQLTTKKMFLDHPLSKNILGTEETTKNATRESLKTYLTKHYRPDQSALIMTGDISHERAVELAEKYFGGWQNPSTAFDSQLKPLTKTSQSYYFEKRDTEQTFLSFNYYYPSLEELNGLKNLAALNLISTYLGQGMTATLRKELREKRGLVYSVRVSSDIHRDASIITISTSTQKPEETIKVIQRVIADIPEKLTSDVFEKIKHQNLGNFIRNYVKPDNQPFSLGIDFINYGRLNTPEEWVQSKKAVKLEDSIALANRYLKPENSVLIVLGPKDIGREPVISS
jgi:predicted Zn-dependent peptidase